MGRLDPPHAGKEKMGFISDFLFGGKKKREAAEAAERESMLQAERAAGRRLEREKREREDAARRKAAQTPRTNPPVAKRTNPSYPAPGQASRSETGLSPQRSSSTPPGRVHNSTFNVDPRRKQREDDFAGDSLSGLHLNAGTMLHQYPRIHETPDPTRYQAPADDDSSRHQCSTPSHSTYNNHSNHDSDNNSCSPSYDPSPTNWD
jgi:hypothetical protein